jgi:hypothetical protein
VVDKLESEADMVSRMVTGEMESDRAMAMRPLTSVAHVGIFLRRRPGEGIRDCINRRLGEAGLEIHIGWIVLGLCGIVATVAGVAGAEAGAIPPAVFAAALCLSFATGVEIGILAGILWDCR